MLKGLSWSQSKAEIGNFAKQLGSTSNPFINWLCGEAKKATKVFMQSLVYIVLCVFVPKYILQDVF